MKRLTEKLRALYNKVTSSIHITGQKHLIYCINNLQGLELNINGVTEKTADLGNTGTVTVQESLGVQPENLVKVKLLTQMWKRYYEEKDEDDPEERQRQNLRIKGNLRDTS